METVQTGWFETKREEAIRKSVRFYQNEKDETIVLSASVRGGRWRVPERSSATFFAAGRTGTSLVR